MPQAIARRLALAMRDFLLQRENLAALVLLIDSRRGRDREEHALAALAHDRGLELIVAATKCDKLRRSERDGAIARLTSIANDPILCSSLSSEGVDQLRRRILKVRETRA